MKSHIESGVKYLRLWKDVLLIGGCKAENGVGVIVIVASNLIGKVVGVESYNDRVMKVSIAIVHRLVDQ